MPSQRLKFSLLCAATLLGGLEGLWGLAAQAQVSSTGSADLAVVRPVMDCADLIWMGQKLSLMAGVPLQVHTAAVAKDAPAPYCDVKGYVSPMVDFEVRLPTTNWTQRFLQVGCGAFCGTLAIQVPNTGSVGNAQIERGELALAATDMGHPTDDGLDGTWLAADPQLRVDFAYRAAHVTAIAAKALMRMYYGQGPKFSYFMGISQGGREAAVESQRYPEDFDGIVCGAPAVNYLTQVTIYHSWNILSNSDKEGHIILTPDKLPILHAAALAACDAKDGLKDGLISDPWNCHVDPAVVQCKEGQDPATCLTPAQVHAAQLIYQGAHDSKGTPLVLSGPLPGSELQWINAGFVAAVPDRSRTISNSLATFSIKYLAFPQNLPLDYDIRDFHFDEETFRALTPMHALYDALNPDLSKFDSAGHKIIFWSGLADGSTAPTNILAYYEAMQSYMGKERAQRFTRLYLFPGGYHGNGNPGPIDCDLLSAMIGWVENGTAPYRLISYYLPFIDQKGGKYGPYGTAISISKSYRSRPVYPYPEVAHYKGSGSIDEAENFDAGMPAAKHSEFHWIGLPSFMRPVQPMWCGWTGMTFSCGTEQK
jgi:feruloyl esterase